MMYRQRLVLMTGLAVMCAAALAWAAEQSETTVVVEPVPLSASQMKLLKHGDGPTLYAEFCSDCHGPRGAGDGVAAEALAAAPTDLTTLTDTGIPEKRLKIHVVNTLTNPVPANPHPLAADEVSMPRWDRILLSGTHRDVAGRLAAYRIASHVASLQIEQ